MERVQKLLEGVHGGKPRWLTLHGRHADPRILKVAFWWDVRVTNKSREFVQIAVVGIEGDKIGRIDVKIDLVQTLAIHLHSAAKGGIQPNTQVLADLLLRQALAKGCGDRISISDKEELEEEDVVITTSLVERQKLGVPLFAN